ncbi:MAG TPA: hypothetical protein VKA49_08475 [Flavitalea sp.]|nr:hypothetical protein [Flavitalea sp.]
MASIGKKFLSAFVDISSDEKTPPVKPIEHIAENADIGKSYSPSLENSVKFLQYFDKLFREANIPGPDYFEFSKMIEAMNSIPDEKARYTAAFAGLSVQGLDKTKLLSTAAEYLRVLNTDASNFDSTVDAALQEKVHTKKKELGEKTSRIEQLSREINELRRGIATLEDEIKENEEKIESNSGAYKLESERMKARIASDIEKIKQHIH